MQVRSLQIVLLAGLLVLGPRIVDAAERVERRLRAMGTDLSILVQAPGRVAALDASERAVAALRRAEARLSTWDPGSETSRVNAAPPGRPIPVSGVLARDLTDALRCSIETDGAFTPGLGRLVRAWGLRTGGRRPADAEIADIVPALRASNLVVAGGTATRLDQRFVIEEGGFGKGVGLDDAIAALESSLASAAVLDLGGQVAVWGATSARVEIADPRDRGRTVLRFEVSHGSVSTTGNSERGIVVDGSPLGHVLDPATGMPGRDFGSVTVWAERAARADCLSTGLYVMGPDRALEWAASRPEVSVVVLETGEHTLKARASENMRERLQPTVDDVELDFYRATATP